MKTFGLYKKQKLCSQTAIDALFSRDGADLVCLRYPIRAVARVNARRRSDAPLCFLISVPKKRLHHAVDRVTMRRRIREAFRLNHAACHLPDGTRIDIAFVYVADKLTDYRYIEKAMTRILENLSSKYAQQPDQPEPAEA